MLKVFLSMVDIVNLITSADDSGNVLLECRGLSPIIVVIPNIQEVRHEAEKAARTNDEIRTLLHKLRPHNKKLTYSEND